METGDEIETDWAICYLLMVEPITLPCAHSFCFNCIVKMLETALTECSLCRGGLNEDFMPRIDKEKQKKIRALKPERFNELEKIQKRIGSCEDLIQIEFGNRHELVEDPQPVLQSEEISNQHSWTVFLKTADEGLSEKIIEKVVFGLHPTFYPPLISVKDTPFELTRIGWGIFEI